MEFYGTLVTDIMFTHTTYFLQ